MTEQINQVISDSTKTRKPQYQQLSSNHRSRALAQQQIQPKNYALSNSDKENQHQCDSSGNSRHSKLVRKASARRQIGQEEKVLDNITVNLSPPQHRGNYR